MKCLQEPMCEAVVMSSLANDELCFLCRNVVLENCVDDATFNTWLRNMGVAATAQSADPTRHAEGAAGAAGILDRVASMIGIQLKQSVLPGQQLQAELPHAEQANMLKVFFFIVVPSFLAAAIALRYRAAYRQPIHYDCLVAPNRLLHEGGLPSLSGHKVDPAPPEGLQFAE